MIAASSSSDFDGLSLFYASLAAMPEQELASRYKDLCFRLKADQLSVARSAQDPSLSPAVRSFWQKNLLELERGMMTPPDIANLYLAGDQVRGVDLLDGRREKWRLLGQALAAWPEIRSASVSICG